jgi:hypothetical protein
VINRGEVTFVVDRKLPEWALEYIMRETDLAASAYADHLGKRSMPLVMIYTSGGGNPYFWGDHLDGTLTLGLYGDWRVESTDLRAKLRGFIDHEIFHTWNASAADHSDPTSLLALEGGAELAKVLLTFERTRNASVALSEVSDAMTRCQLELPQLTSLRTVLKDPRPGRVPYDCGMMLMFLMTVHQRGSGLDDRDFWQSWEHLLTDGKKGKKHVWTSVVNSGRSQSPGGSIDKIVDSNTFDVAGEDAIRESGYRLLTRSSLTPDLASLAGQKIMMGIMSADCVENYGFFTTRDGYQLDNALPDCGTFKAAKTVREIAGMKPWVEPIALNAKIRELCDAGKPVTVTYADAPPSLIACNHKVKSFTFSQISMGGQ